MTGTARRYTMEVYLVSDTLEHTACLKFRSHVPITGTHDPSATEIAATSKLNALATDWRFATDEEIEDYIQDEQD